MLAEPSDSEARLEGGDDARYSGASLECGLCGKKFFRRSFLRCHIRLEHTDNSTKYNCQYCGREFTTKSNMQKHVNVIHKKISTKYNCQYCGREFTTKSNMQKHVNVIHKKILKHICDASDECSESFGSKQQLLAHKRKKHRSLKLRCTKCDGKFISISNLKEHQKICSIQNEAYACGQCNKKFKVKRYLKAHEKSFHDQSGACMCDACGDGFSTKGSLKRHLKRKHQ